ncbi:MAG TPA: hypothetical protein ENN73_06480, partial [Firmicutes bacterium]|nr:hypothetical protein [Bacillota bacterium]
LIIQEIYDVTPLEEELMHELITRSQEVYFGFDRSKESTKTTVPLDNFIKQLKSKYKISETRIETPRDPILDLAAEFSAGFKGAEKNIDLQDQIYFIESSGIERQIRSLFIDITEKIILKGISPDKVSILWKSDTVIQKIIMEESLRFGVPVQFNTAVPKYLPLQKFITDLLQLFLNYPSAENLMLVLRSPFSGIDPEKIEMLETAIRGEYFLFDIPEFKEFLCKREDPAFEVIVNFLNLLNELRGRLDKVQNFKDGIEELYRLFTVLSLQDYSLLRGLPGGFDNVVFMNRLTVKLNRFSELCENTGVSCLLREEILKILISVVSGILIESEEGEKSGIRVIDFSSARGIFNDYIYMINLQEDTIPSPGQLNPFYSYSEISELNKKRPGTFYRHSERLQKERYLFYLLLKTARKRLTFCYNKYDDDGIPLNISPFIHEIKRFISEDYYNKHLTLITPDKILPELRDAYNRDNYIQRLVYNLSNTGDPVYHYLSKLSDDEILKIRYVLSGRLFEFKTILTPENTEILQSFNLEMSQTKLSSYLECPFSFFIAHIVKVEPVRVGVLPTKTGSNVHTILKSFFEKLKKEGYLPLKNTSFNDFEQIFINVFDSFPRTFSTGTYPYYELLERTRARKICLKYIRYEYEYLKTHPDFVPLYFEEKLGFKKEEFIIEAGEVRFRFKGTIDRVD